MTVWSFLLPCFLFVFGQPSFINTLHNSIHPQEFISIRYSLNGTLLDKCHSKPFLHTIHKLHTYPHFRIPIHHNHLLIGHIRIHLIVAPYQNRFGIFFSFFILSQGGLDEQQILKIILLLLVCLYVDVTLLNVIFPVFINLYQNVLFSIYVFLFVFKVFTLSFVVKLSIPFSF